MVSKPAILGCGRPNQIDTSHQKLMKIMDELKELLMKRGSMINSSSSHCILTDEHRPPPAPPHQLPELPSFYTTYNRPVRESQSMPSDFQQAFGGNNTFHQSLTAMLPQIKSSTSVDNLPPQSVVVPSGYGIVGNSSTILITVPSVNDSQADPQLQQPNLSTIPFHTNNQQTHSEPEKVEADEDSLVENYGPSENKDLYIKSVKRAVIWMGKKKETIEDVLCEDTVAMADLDQFITKDAALTNQKEVDAHFIKAMKYSVSPVVRVAVQCKVFSDLPKLVEGLKRLLKSDPITVCTIDPITVCTIEECGEHILVAAVKLHLEDLKNYVMGLQRKKQAKVQEEYRQNKYNYLKFLETWGLIKVNTHWQKIQDRKEENEHGFHLKTTDRLKAGEKNVFIFDPGDLVVASAGDDKKITLWQKIGQSMGTIPASGEGGDNIEECISSISFSNKGSRYICSGGSGQVVRIWNLQRKRCIKCLRGHTDTITSAMYNCKYEHLASISLSGDIIIYNLASAARATELKDPNGQVLRVLDYSRISRHLLVTAGDDGSVHLWDSTGHSPKLSWLKQHSAPTAGVSFSPTNDKVIASIGLDKKLYTLDSGSRRSVSCIPYEAPFSSLAFRDDGNILAAGTSNGRVVFYDVHGKPAPFTVLWAYGNSKAVTSLCWQRSKPVTVNERNCTADAAILGVFVEDSVLMPDPLPSMASLFLVTEYVVGQGQRKDYGWNVVMQAHMSDKIM